MPVRNDNRFAMPRAAARARSEGLTRVLAAWPRGWDRPSAQQRGDLERVADKFKRAAVMRNTQPWVSLKRDEREALWWLSYAARSVEGPDAEPWAGIHAMLWLDA